MTDQITPNIPLLRKAVEWVEYQATLPEIDREWLQSMYVCQPVAHAMRLLSPIDEADRINRHQLAQVTAHCGTAYCVAGYIGMITDERFRYGEFVDGIHVSEFAREELGLTSGQAAQLFAGVNTAADVRRIAEFIAGEKL